MTGFATILRDIAARTPQAPALTYGDITWSFGEFDARCSQVAQALRAEGIGPGERVGVLSRNCPGFLEVIFACNKIGAIVVGLNWRLSPPELEAIVADARPAFIFAGENGEEALLTQAARETPGLRRILMFGAPYEAWRDAASTDDPGIDGAPHDVAMILYTSGTTGLPKGAMLTNLGMSHTRRLGEEWGMGAQSVNLVAMPLFHIGGCGYGTSTLLNGGHTVLMPTVDLPAIITAIERHRVTNAFFVPTILQDLLAVPGIEKADLSSLKLLMYGASPISETLLQRALGVLDCGFMQAYGMTETSGTVVTLGPEEHLLTSNPRLRSCGRALPFADIMIADPVTTNPVPARTVGEILVRSDMVMKGYWEKPEATAEAITADGWLHTGDAAFQDEDGFIYLYDRMKDMIISGGENIYPAELENVLLAHPDVKEAAVIGVPHPRWVETPLAIIVPRSGSTPTSEHVIAFMRTRLAHYKCPTAVILAESLPRNASGKLLKQELRLRYGPEPDVRAAT